MRTPLLLALVLAGAALLTAGCDQSGRAQSQFAEGAFPPTLSDMEYHRNDWTRGNCLSCHEEGVNDAPKTVHRSLPPEAKEVKCRSCHVFIAESLPKP